MWSSCNRTACVVFILIWAQTGRNWMSFLSKSWSNAIFSSRWIFPKFCRKNCRTKLSSCWLIRSSALITAAIKSKRLTSTSFRCVLDLPVGLLPGVPWYILICTFSKSEPTAYPNKAPIGPPSTKPRPPPSHLLYFEKKLCSANGIVVLILNR